jgi:hypothetical protein
MRRFWSTPGERGGIALRAFCCHGPDLVREEIGSQNRVTTDFSRIGALAAMSLNPTLLGVALTAVRDN